MKKRTNEIYCGKISEKTISFRLERYNKEQGWTKPCYQIDMKKILYRKYA